ncbi:MAG: hypothetical protein AAF958_05935 [Planctomycetota bacterium]
MIKKIGKTLGLLCVATLLTQIILLGYFASKGTLSGKTITQVLALMNGIDITGGRLQAIMQQSEDREEPNFEEILQARKLESYDMDLRMSSQKMFDEELRIMLADLREDRDRLNQRLDAFRKELGEIEQEALDDGLRNAARMIQSLEPAMAKEQLLIMLNDKRENDVITIIKAMPPDLRRDILAEFDGNKDQETLAEIFRLIAEGRPTTTLIDQARANR